VAAREGAVGQLAALAGALAQAGAEAERERELAAALRALAAALGCDAAKAQFTDAHAALLCSVLAERARAPRCPGPLGPGPLDAAWGKARRLRLCCPLPGLHTSCPRRYVEVLCKERSTTARHDAPHSARERCQTGALLAPGAPGVAAGAASAAAAAAHKHEGNKCRLVDAGLGGGLVAVLRGPCAEDARAVVAVCSALRSMATADDARPTTSRCGACPEPSRQILHAGQVLPGGAAADCVQMQWCAPTAMPARHTAEAAVCMLLARPSTAYTSMPHRRSCGGPPALALEFPLPRILMRHQGQ